MVKCQKIRKRNIVLSLSYDGTNFYGWQRLPKKNSFVPTIQGMLETILTELTGEPVLVHGSGRTDKGVHAIEQVCNFLTNSILSEEQFLKLLNERLPEDIRIQSVREADLSFHSRYSAKQKVYQYRFDLSDRESVFCRKYTYPAHCVLDIGKMQEAAKCLVGTHDFKAYCTDRKDNKSTIRTITSILIYQEKGKHHSQEAVIEISGDGFLHHMVRIIAGTLLEAGKNEREISDILLALKTKQRKDAGPCLYPQGLYLKKVIY